MSYRAAAASRTVELREKRSRFLASSHPVATEAAAKEIVAALRIEHPQASHVCWAVRLGPEEGRVERASDDGEPAGTAGAPILRAITAAEMSDVLVAVVRWFGGIKLGKGGLARAYGGSAREVLEATPSEERFETSVLAVEASYEQEGALRRLLQPPEIVLGESDYEEVVRARLVVRVERLAEVTGELDRLGVPWKVAE